MFNSICATLCSFVLFFSFFFLLAAAVTWFWVCICPCKLLFSVRGFNQTEQVKQACWVSLPVCCSISYRRSWAGNFYCLIYWILIFSFFPCHLTPENFFLLGVETFFNLAFVQTFFFFFFLLLSGEHGRRRCEGNRARGGDLSYTLSTVHQEGFPACSVIFSN